MTIRLRPHHLLCLLTYAGKGYTQAFVANYDAVAKRIGAGEGVDVVSGPDDICAPLLDDTDAHCFNASVAERDRLAARDVGRLLGCEITVGQAITIDAAMLVRLRTAFAAGTIRPACSGCEWQALCDGIAANSFEDTRLAFC